MAKWNKWIQIMAILALFGIVIWIIWTWLIIMFGSSSSVSEQTLTPEQYLELQELMKANSGSINQTWTWVENIEILSGSIIKEDADSWTGEIEEK